MASFVSTSTIPVASLPCNNACRSTICQLSHSLSSSIRSPLVGGLRLAPKIKITRATERSLPLPSSCFKTSRISCSIANSETLKTVQSTIAKQLSIDENSVTPSTKFAELGADSLDTVEIMMALEEKFGVSIGEGGAENILTVQDAADLIGKVKAAAS
ncbi:Acyl carrier protein 1 [Morus notabilis]|uniref:Acyl carrier protein n=1 Tax=Morus notabilis TaxID=981085 RepID=W9RP07_9ROSA|nr:uncharacterized protein LOC21388518 [Morus notabilis]EXC01334.1 Acyl carrier protein 1 [Morus notabilis]